MNVWSLDKDSAIKHLLLLLQMDLPLHAYQYSDTSAVDHKAIRLCHPQEQMMCAYIYTYGHMADRYGVHLEFPAANAMNYSDTMDIHENLSYPHLLELLKVHFEISDDEVNNTPHTDPV